MAAAHGGYCALPNYKRCCYEKIPRGSFISRFELISITSYFYVRDIYVRHISVLNAIQPYYVFKFAKSRRHLFRARLHPLLKKLKCIMHKIA